MLASLRMYDSVVESEKQRGCIGNGYVKVDSLKNPWSAQSYGN